MGLKKVCKTGLIVTVIVLLSLFKGGMEYDSSSFPIDKAERKEAGLSSENKQPERKRGYNGTDAFTERILEYINIIGNRDVIETGARLLPVIDTADKIKALLLAGKITARERERIASLAADEVTDSDAEEICRILRNRLSDGEIDELMRMAGKYLGMLNDMN